MRMVYHSLARLMIYGSTRWPSDWDARGPRNATADPRGCPLNSAPPSSDERSTSNAGTSSTSDGTKTPAAHRNETLVMCVQEIFAGGARLTFVWVDLYSTPRQLDPLRQLAALSVGTPDVLLASIGAWFVYKVSVLGGPFEMKEAFASAVNRLTTDLDSVFRPPSLDARYFGTLTSHQPLRLWLSVPNCGAAHASFVQADSNRPRFRFAEGLVVHQLNALLHTIVTAQRQPAPRSALLQWQLLDRGAITLQPNPCDATRPWPTAVLDCQLGSYHPTGDTLDAILKHLLKHVLKHIRQSQI